MRCGSSASYRLSTSYLSVRFANGLAISLWRRCWREHVAVQRWFRLLACSALKLWLYQVCRSVGEFLIRSIVLGSLQDSLLVLRPSKASECVGPIRCRDETSSPKIILSFQVFDLGCVGTVHNANGDGEDSVALQMSFSDSIVHVTLTNLCFLTDSFINHVMVGHHFLFGGKRKILKTGFFLL